MSSRPSRPFPVPEWMQGLKLVVRHRGPNDGIDRRGVVTAHPIDEILESRCQVVARRWRDEARGMNRQQIGLCITAATNYDLCVTNVSRLVSQGSSLHEQAL